ncbi:MAG: LruC domain-containing protein [Bacteroidales bacterium]|jgi:LruC domain-containing protein
MKFRLLNSSIKFKGFILIVVLFAMIGCNKKGNNPTPNESKEFADLKISSDFKFETTQEINLQIEVVSQNPQEPTHKFKIFLGDPNKGGKLMMSGITDPYLTYQSAIVVPAYATSLFIQNQDVNNQIETVEAEIINGTIHYSFNSSTKIVTKNSKTFSPLHIDPGCNTYDVALSGNYSSIDFENNMIYCVLPGTSVTITNQAKFKGGTLIVGGSINMNNITVQGNDGGEFYISSGGVYNTSNGNFQKLDLFVNFGVTAISSNLTLTNCGQFENQGIMNIGGGINTNSNAGNLYNSGTMNIAGNVNNGDFIYNMGTMIVSGHFNNNGGNIELHNECNLIITGNFNQNSDFYNYENAYVQVGQNTYLNGSSNTYMEAQSLFKTFSIHFNKNVHGPSASCARFEIANETRINGSGNIDGHIDICDANGIDSNNGTVGPDVTFDCSCFIPTTNCNPGAGTPSNPDSDGDGCPDDQDDYPNDPERCSNDYYPNQTDFTSLAFEDLWTGTGDYDFNDLVVATNYKIVKNGENKVVEVFGKFHIAAVGASLNNGFGIEFTVPTSTVASVTGTQIVGSAVSIGANGMEQGPLNKAVLIVYDAINDYLGTAMVNTVPGGNTMDIDTISVHMVFATPQENIGTPPYNPFMFINQERGKEIHLIDHAPTEMADLSYFGQDADNSNPAIGRYYVTSTNLPWVIEVPDSFEWPVEKVDILSAYLKFRDWAESSGADYPDWYLDLSGYRNPSNIYQPVN